MYSLITDIERLTQKHFKVNRMRKTESYSRLGMELSQYYFLEDVF